MTVQKILDYISLSEPEFAEAEVLLQGGFELIWQICRHNESVGDFCVGSEMKIMTEAKKVVLHEYLNRRLMEGRAVCYDLSG